jgi:hypothetical protein
VPKFALEVSFVDLDIMIANISATTLNSTSDIELQNKAFLLKQLHKFYCKKDIPWVKLVWDLYDQGAPHTQSSRWSFWRRDIFSLVGDYRSITTTHIGNGQATLFWKDFWRSGGTLCNQFPRLFS